MSESKVTYGNVPGDVAAQFEGLLVGHGMSYVEGYQLLHLLAESWPAPKEDNGIKFAELKSAHDNMQNAIKDARMQLAALLKQPMETYEEMSLGDMINCLATKVAFPHPDDLPPKLSEQFSHGKPIAFIADRRDTCRIAITKLLRAEGCLTSTEIFERLRIVYEDRWGVPTMRTTLSQLVTEPLIGKTPGQTRTLYYI